VAPRNGRLPGRPSAASASRFEAATGGPFAPANQIKNAPEFDETNYREDAYRSQVGGYYYGGTTGADR
jgi:hypothetical protein